MNTVRILIPGTKLNSQEKLEMAKYLVKAGYAVSITREKARMVRLFSILIIT